MGLAQAWSVALYGIDGLVVEIEADVGMGQPRTQLLGLPDAALKISPFENLPRLPGQEMAATPLLIIGTLVVGLLAVAGAGLRRRDIDT